MSRWKKDSQIDPRHRYCLPNADGDARRLTHSRVLPIETPKNRTTRLLDHQLLSMPYSVREGHVLPMPLQVQ